MPPMSANPEETKLQASLSLCSTAVLDCLEAIRSGHELSFEQALLLATVDGADLDALVSFPYTLRPEAVGETITYALNRNINFPTLCFVGSIFCAFGKGPDTLTPYALSF